MIDHHSATSLSKIEERQVLVSQKIHIHNLIIKTLRARSRDLFTLQTWAKVKMSHPIKLQIPSRDMRWSTTTQKMARKKKKNQTMARNTQCNRAMQIHILDRTTKIQAASRKDFKKLRLTLKTRTLTK